MTITEVEGQTTLVAGPDAGRFTQVKGRPPRDLQRTFRLVLATVWLLDAALQLQPFMFTRGSSGFSGMLNGLASGNPVTVHGAVTWNASNVYHYPILSNTIFAGVQFLIAFGIVYKRTCKSALSLSIVWSLGVWWFGEAAGQVFQGGATPFSGGPGGVLFYAVLAVLLWPIEGSRNLNPCSTASWEEYCQACTGAQGGHEKIGSWEDYCPGGLRGGLTILGGRHRPLSRVESHEL